MLCDEGYAGQMILSHDCSCYSDKLTPAVFASLGGGGPWSLTTVPDCASGTACSECLRQSNRGNDARSSSPPAQCGLKNG